MSIQFFCSYFCFLGFFLGGGGLHQVLIVVLRILDLQCSMQNLFVIGSDELLVAA